MIIVANYAVADLFTQRRITTIELTIHGLAVDNDSAEDSNGGLVFLHQESFVPGIKSALRALSISAPVRMLPLPRGN